MSMNTLSTCIDNADQATRAAQWCKRNRITYNLEFWGWPGSTKYRFVFENDNDLVLFSLKWV
jgi:hypothetical protein